MSDMHDLVVDTLADAIGRQKGSSAGFLYEIDHLPFDQQLQVLQVEALILVAVEINHLRHGGINPEFDNFH